MDEPDEPEFVTQILADVGSETLWLVAADHLQERGRPGDEARAARYRAAALGCRVLVELDKKPRFSRDVWPGGRPPLGHGPVDPPGAYEWWASSSRSPVPFDLQLAFQLRPGWWERIETDFVYRFVSKDFTAEFDAWLAAGEAFARIPNKNRNFYERRAVRLVTGADRSGRRSRTRAAH